MNAYTYTIFDANPNTSSGTAWPTHTEIEIEADSDGEAEESVREIMSGEAAGLNPADGYDAGDKLYAIIWDADNVIASEPAYEITHDDLGTEPEPKLATGANTSHESAEEMYEAYGWHIDTERAGSVMLQAVDFDWLDETDDRELLDTHRDAFDEMTDREALRLIARAREVRDAMEGIESKLGEAVSAYEAGDVAGCIEALDEASSMEREHGDDPATSKLRAKLIA